MIVSDIYEDVYEVTAFPDEARNFSRISDAVTTLNNKGNFDALLGYMRISVVDQDIVTLPADVQAPLRVNIDGNPSFPRDKFYEFTMNGPGSDAALVDWSWVDHGLTPVMQQPTAATALEVTGNAADNGKEVTIYGRAATGEPLAATYEIGAAQTSLQFIQIERIRKDVTQYGVTLQTIAPVVLGQYYASDTEPIFRQIRLSTTEATSVYILFRSRVFAVTALTDYIPIQSKMGLIYMVKALEAYRNDNPTLGQSLEALALKLATEEQSANNPFVEISGAIDAPSCRGLSYGRRDILTVSDIWDDACMTFGPIGYEKMLDRVTETAQALANKSNWDTMISYLRITTTDQVVTLPYFVEVPLKVTIDGNPAFARDRFYEFSMNGPGTGGLEGGILVGWQWVDRGAVPVAFQPEVPTTIQASGVAADNGKVITVVGETDESEIAVELLTLGHITDSFSTATFRRIISVQKPITTGRVTLQTADNTQILSIYGPLETLPQYRQIRLSQASTNVYIQYREKTPVFTDIDNIIAVRSRMAFVLMMRSIRAFRDGKIDEGRALEEQAVKMANEEQASYNAFVDIASKTESPTISNQTYNSRDSIIAADLYDDFSAIFGPVGEQKLHDKMTDAVEALANKGQWDPLVGYVDINTDQYHYVTLPRYVEQILALKQSNRASEFRNRWFEFNMDGWSNCSPCGGWQEAGEVCTNRDVPYSIKLSAIPESPNDDGKKLLVYGYFRGKRIATQNSDNTTTDGAAIVLDSSGATESDVLFDRIERILKPTTNGCVTLNATNSRGLESFQVGFYYPGETNPRYRRIKLSKGCTQIRIMYRKRSSKITSWLDPIHLGNKLAVVTMGRAIKLMDTDLVQANALEMKAEQYLRDEQQSNNPLDMPELEWADNSWHHQMI